MEDNRDIKKDSQGTGRSQSANSEDNIKNSLNNEDSDYPDTGHTDTDTGTGTGGTDYVGKASGRNVDESIVGDVSGGGTTTGMYSTVGGATIGGVTTEQKAVSEEGDITDTHRSGIGDTGAEAAKPDQSAKGGTGTGAASNDRGARLDDIPTGTGSAQRGNQAGIDDAGGSKIVGGTTPTTGLGDPDTAENGGTWGSKDQ